MSSNNINNNNVDFKCFILIFLASSAEEKEKLQTFWLVKGGKSKVLLRTLMMALFHLAFPLSHHSVTVSKDAEYWYTEETEAHKWNSAIINFVIYTCTFHTVYMADNVIYGLKMLKLLNNL